MVEHRTVNPSVVSSSLTGAAKPLESNISGGFFAPFFVILLFFICFFLPFTLSDCYKKSSGGKWGKNSVVEFFYFLQLKLL